MRTQTPVPARAINSAAIDLENLATLSRTPPTCGSLPLEPGRRIEYGFEYKNQMGNAVQKKEVMTIEGTTCW